MTQSASHRVIYSALSANFVIAIAKFVAANFTGSTAMLAEGIHSTVDTADQLLLLLGVKRSRVPPDRRHPFGHGKELYFWSLIVAMLLFGLGGGLAIYEGAERLLHPEPLKDPRWSYAVLAVAAVFDGNSFRVAVLELWRNRGTAGFLMRARDSKDPAVFMTFFEDGAALIGLIIAFLGVWIAHRYDNVYVDGIASILIGTVLAVIASMLIYEVRGLIIGESASDEVVESVGRIVDSDPCVSAARRPLTMHLSPDEVLVNLDVEFKQGTSADDHAAAVRRIERAIRAAHPEITRIYIEARDLA